MSNFYDDGKKIKGQWEYLNILFLQPSINCHTCDIDNEYLCSHCEIDMLSNISNVKYTDDCEWIIKKGKKRQFNKIFKKPYLKRIKNGGQCGIGINFNSSMR